MLYFDQFQVGPDGGLRYHRTRAPNVRLCGKPVEGRYVRHKGRRYATDAIYKALEGRLLHPAGAVPPIKEAA